MRRGPSGTTPGMVYTVELGLKGSQKAFKSLAKNCTCKDFLKRGPGCKHVGAVLIGLAARAEPPGPALMLEAEARARAALARPGEVPRRVRLELGDTPRGEAAGSAFEPPARRAGVQAFASVREKAERLRDAEHQKNAREWAFSAEAEGPAAVGVLNEAVQRAPGLGKVVELLDGVSSQERAIEVIGRAKEFVMLFAFTFDRADVTKALLDAHARGCKVSAGVDKRWTLNGKTRDQLSRLQELAAQGIDVRVLVGTAYDVEYRAVQRAARLCWGGPTS